MTDGRNSLRHHIFLIRHGETVDNVAGLYAGSRDSALTNHGVQQAQRLGQHFANINVTFSYIFSSDLSRAYKTAEAIRDAQNTIPPLEVLRVPDIREQDFGQFEGKPFYARSTYSSKSGKDLHRATHKDDEGFQDIESKVSMAKRADKFLDEILLPILNTEVATDGSTIAIVSHGIILSNLWRCILRRQPPNTVAVSPMLLSVGRPLVLEHLGGWGNTGFLELYFEKSNFQSTMPIVNSTPDQSEHASTTSPTNRSSDLPSLSANEGHDENDGCIPSSPVLKQAPGPTQALNIEHVLAASSFLIKIQTINGREHLQGLKRTGGGVGSSKFDEGQTSIKSFFKRQKTS